MARSAARDAEARVSADAAAEYDKIKAAAENMYADGEKRAVDKVNDVKAGWLSWLGFGKAKAEEAKREAAEKAARAADEFKRI
jgi:hypothetical protein